MDEIMLKIDNVSKIYRLGQIGGTTLRDELQRTMAKLRHQEDPTKRIGTKSFNQGESFMALNGVSLEVKKGERVGIIGHNGAGKSTLLKLISRVTAPTGGTISMNGRVASMLEVGTGFHGELTGRENIYMNGAILGMTKKEIDAKMEDIVEFSECRQFIDTPVKRYSSGMYVKLAFSVAAHLDSEIMIMDEVLAVGDMAFQKKCIDKMNLVSQDEGRTILYVSHNMNTIRQLCTRCIVLDHGTIVYNGDVESAIGVYMNISENSNKTEVDLDKATRVHAYEPYYKIRMTSLKFLDRDNCIVERGETLKIRIVWKVLCAINDVRFRITIRSSNDNTSIGTTLSESVCDCKEGQNYSATFLLNTLLLSKGQYYFNIAAFHDDGRGNILTLDFVYDACGIRVREDQTKDDSISIWETTNFGYFHYPMLELVKE